MRIAAYMHHHERFYAAVLSGLAAFCVARLLHFGADLLLGGDVFFLVFLVLCVPLIAESPARLAKRADSDDEGMAVVLLVTLITIAFFCTTVFVSLKAKHVADGQRLLLAAIGAPLGWAVLHTAMAFHYANLHYFDDPETPADDARDLDFPGCDQPGPWDFLYFSFVIGMTCQVSDVAVKTSVMRRAVLGHGIVSFFFNTVFIAMAVNAAVAIAG